MDLRLLEGRVLHKETQGAMKLLGEVQGREKVKFPSTSYWQLSGQGPGLSKDGPSSWERDPPIIVKKFKA